MPARALLLSAVWVAAVLLLYHSGALQAYFGTAQIGKFPNWRNFLMLPGQCIVLPTLWLLSRRQHNQCMLGLAAAWCGQHAHGMCWGAHLKQLRTGETPPSPGSINWCWDWAFVFFFAAQLVMDAYLVPDMGALMLLHHAVCLLGHIYGTFMCTRAFPFYFAGCIALELGSAACNIWTMYPQTPGLFSAYAIVMTLSNVLAIRCFNRCAYVPRMNICFGITLFGGLVVMRQRELLIRAFELNAS
eukprot:CAMPEP_0119319970 /NCGR_PEP_ID=MMETSP1333-20130426/51016_1 /TAXON_ID=418940 /ORGANISM="Scyphosphaera apsteinii, Strain RCC1455" /LENGTH=243 /DNA_ID=CAMNT_0007326545 /DNA_START=156 /DNA_END=887 /DNA_ORIENTATION=-